jgi:hypothetical protein
MSVRLALVMLAACGSKEPPPADCSTVSHGIQQYWNDRAAQTADVEELAAIHETSKTTSEKFERHCRADHWNPDMIACARAVFRLEDSGCMKFMSNLQKQKWQQGVEAPPIKGGMGIGG